MAQVTPMMKQYLEIKAQYEDAFLFFRLGDFYELFNEDAIKASRELEITLTARGQSETRIPMCGVPHHAAENYMTRLIEKGYKVAICEQVEDPETAKGVVKREVVKLLTPGTMMSDRFIQEKENNYLSTIHLCEDGTYGVAFADLSTGEGRVTVTGDEQEDAVQEVLASKSKEVIVASTSDTSLLDRLKKERQLTISFEDELDDQQEYAWVYKDLKQSKLEATYARLLRYLVRTQKRSLAHLQPATYYASSSYLKMDQHTKRNLELTETLREKRKQGSLLSIVDQTVTAMGGRMLRQWIERPLVSKDQIVDRQSAVETFLTHFFEREELRDELKAVYDLERLAARVAYGSVSPRELVQLKRSLQRLPAIKQLLVNMKADFAKDWFNDSDTYQQIADLLDKSLIEDAPISLKEGGIIQSGYHDDLDTYRDASANGKQWIAELEAKERQVTGIRTLKVGYNRVFGYYIEITRANAASIPEGRYERKQTLTNAERFVTPELKEKEALILEANDQTEKLEYNLFVEIRDQVKTFVPDLQRLARHMSELDVYASFATVSEQRRYVKPTFSEDRKITLVNNRHPVVETVIPRGQYVPNDVSMGEDRGMLLLTGPNMGGKSTYMRQLALSAVMAQIGCYVPADEADLPVFDQIFTRIGAADDLASGQSTFMVEMLETKHALTKATQNSLLLLDEIGRGTSTYDGMALAQAIMEFIHDRIQAKTMFSTHYHELTEMEHSLTQLQNIHVSAAEQDGHVVFLHKVIDGPADRSYGIYVAELAGLPHTVTARAEKLLAELEGAERETAASIDQSVETVQPTEIAESDHQLSLFASDDDEKVSKKAPTKKEKQVLAAIGQADLMHLTPFEAMQLINEWQKNLKN
ncbi:DNA mismatch repair protein MutS [Alkalicoccobacillus murimartini]|uniref:DNA mismatch repair protein MutS n=1 Tax=Alkalicoccobacillus murimartini TaxID=171685 RepID=A0ABT9YGB7_9BACI|nr:DNA mismatch repair protein MutS [Alkalicoccobacillus murimartini]MDQ0206262.1 DNA mismatch repair protein MutS [Alkalicoccobacillus murimartini]